MPEIGSSGLMSGDGNRGVGHRPQATAPILDSTKPDILSSRSDFARVNQALQRKVSGELRR